ncbi:MAG: arginine--tRNA ligase [Chloroflexota bacterium]|nr:arginine--tRNA ligase [Chloroflexota bacterium]
MASDLIRDRISELVESGMNELRKEGLVKLATTPEIIIERPSNQEHGDFATNLPLRLSRSTNLKPMELAQKLADKIPVESSIDRVEAAHPGFVNFYLSDSWVQTQVDVVRHLGASYGNLDVGNDREMMVEFVSVNPTGPVHVGHARGAVLGSALANILTAAGYSVTREYYVNDAGSQMEAFYRSVYSRYMQDLGFASEFPSNGYRGEYILEIAREIISSVGDKFTAMDELEAIKEIGAIAREKMVSVIASDLEGIGVRFDNWFSEHSLYDSNEYDQAMQILRDKGYLTERENALWFASTLLGEDKDNVVVRSSGEPTYFASDIAYHYNKFSLRRFEKVINIWGADHQGHVPRMKAAVTALGLDGADLTVLIAQLVTLKRGEEVVRASKRTGQFVTLSELVDEVGADACRYFFLARAASTQMEFDLELAKKESSENPVYYVQYAHARNVSILNLARSQNIDWTSGDLTLLTDPNELNLIRTMVRLPELIEYMSTNLEPHHLPHYAMELAIAFHWFYENCRVISANREDDNVTLARLKLVEAAQIVLKNTLVLMGMTAPERM